MKKKKESEQPIGIVTTEPVRARLTGFQPPVPVLPDDQITLAATLEGDIYIVRILREGVQIWPERKEG